MEKEGESQFPWDIIGSTMIFFLSVLSRVSEHVLMESWLGRQPGVTGGSLDWTGSQESGVLTL